MASVQSRIAAFEAKTRSDDGVLDLHDWVLDDMPPSPHLPPPQVQLQPSSPPRQKPKPKPKPPALQGVKKIPAIPPPPPPRRRSTDSDMSFLYPPLGGGGVVEVKLHTDENGKKGNHVAASSVSSFHSVSLSSDNGTDPGTPSSVGTSIIPTYPIDRVPSASSLTESFEEVSFTPSMNNNNSLAPPPPLPHRPTTVLPPTAHSEHMAPPTSTPLPYVPRRVPPPPLSTSRASDRSSIQSLASATSSLSQRTNSSVLHTPTLTTTLPLPLPSSLLSPASTTNGGSSAAAAASIKTKRPTPVPSAARKRYISVFNANIVQRRRAEAQSPSPKKLSHAEAKAKRTRQAAGWRGLSVDLITATPEELLDHDQRVKGKQKEWDVELVVDENVGLNERLEGGIVRAIWSRSRIEKSKLSEIWNECDSDGKGSLDADSFVRGMWRIDEHLRRTQVQTSALRNATSTSLTSLRSGLGSIKIKPAPPGVHRSTSRSSTGTSISRSSSVNGNHRPHSSGGTHSYPGRPPPPPLPKIVLQ